MRVRAKAAIQDIGRGKEAIVVTELPFMVKKGGDGGVIKKIADLVHEKKITEITQAALVERNRIERDAQGRPTGIFVDAAMELGRRLRGGDRYLQRFTRSSSVCSIIRSSTRRPAGRSSSGFRAT